MFREPNLMMHDLEDTIAAIATAPGGAYRGIIRVSGPRAAECVKQCFRATDGARLDDVSLAQAIVGELVAGGRHLPCDLFLWPGRRSYTRAPVAELHTFGAPPLLERALEAICRSGARLAEPGEFTLRAFLAGRIDLTQAEAVLGVIDAENAAQLNSALAQLAGGLAGPLHRLREELLQLLAELETGLDFVEEDIEFISSQQLAARLAEASATLAQVARQIASRGDTAQLRRVVLTGPPNVGKSSLFNAMVRQFGKRDRDPSPAAIVSDQLGTTRDYLIGQLDLDGVECDLIDTAGIAESPRSIEAASQAAAESQRENAVLRIDCIEAAQVAKAESNFGGNSQSQPPMVDMSDIETDKLPADATLVVATKCDLDRAPETVAREPGIIVTSSQTGAGLDELAAAIRDTLLRQSDESGAVASTVARCRDSLHGAGQSLRRARDLVDQGDGEELVAGELRLALAELGRVVGQVYTDDVLDRIFSTFCVGK